MIKKYYNKMFLNSIRRAIEEFDMIKENDIVLVGLSGGKDSTLLLYALNLLSKYSNLKFDVIGVHIDYGWDVDLNPLIEFCTLNEIKMHIERTNIKEKLDFENPKNVCSLCARYRKGIMATVAKKYGATKIAFGHHMDDAVQTFFMNLVCTGKLGSFSPKNYNSQKGMCIIRPMVYLREENIIKAVQIESLPIIPSPCPLNKKTKRQEMKNLVDSMSSQYPDIREKVITSLSNIYEDGLWKK